MGSTGKPIPGVNIRILYDTKIRRYFELGCGVKGPGRGHAMRIKYEVINNNKFQLQG